MKPGIDAEQHAGRVGRFGEQAVNVVAEGQLQAECHAAGAAANAARQVDEQRVIGIDHAPCFGKLRLQALAGYGIAEEQRARVFIINEKAVRVGFRCLAPLFDGDAVVLFVLNDRHAVAAQFGFFPRPGIRRHMYRNLKADARAHDADRHPEVAGGADSDAVLAEELFKFRCQQFAIIICGGEQSGLQRQLFRMGQHFINPATRLNGTRNRQVAVFFQQQIAANRLAELLLKAAFHCRNGNHFRFDNPAAGGRFRESFRQIGREALKAGMGVLHIVGG